MAKNRISYHNWIVDIGYDPHVGFDPHAGGDPQVGGDPPMDLKPHIEPVSGEVDGTELDTVELDDPGLDDISDSDLAIAPEAGQTEHIRQAVGLALESLGSDEREFVIRFYYMGQSYRHMSEESGRAIYKLAALHKRTLRKLKAALTPFVQERFSIKRESEPACRLCRSPHREEIDRIIDSRNPESTWRPVIRQLRERFDIKTGSPQLLIGHARYHRSKPVRL